MGQESRNCCFMISDEVRNVEKEKQIKQGVSFFLSSWFHAS